MSISWNFEISSGCAQFNFSRSLLMSIIIFVNQFFGIRTEALRASVIDLACEPVSAGMAFHLFLVVSGDLIQHVVTQEEVSTDRVGNVQRIKPTFGAFVRHSTVAV